MEFQNKIFIVSGTSSGIGNACALDLLTQEAFVIGLDRKEATISHQNYNHYMVDIRNESIVKEMIDEIQTKYKNIHGLVNCVGIFASGKPFYDINLDEWNNVISTNLTGMFILSKYVSKSMIAARRGAIVNISCIRSKLFRPNMSEYAASKAGVSALTSTMALDLANYHIRVNSVAPGFTYTGMTKDSFDKQEIREFSESLIPAGKIAKPDEIASIVTFLLSEKSNYINGETIYADGGYTIMK
jgi:NAD(P)-dependent dehydrogenase (short-subunit alcohol dehydrogenase family)